MLRAEAAAASTSAVAILNAEFASNIAAARSRFKGAELAAALNSIHQHHLAAERALASKLANAARARRRTVLAALRARRKAHGRNFQAAAVAHGNVCRSAPESVLKDRRQFRIRRTRGQRSAPKPKR